MSDPSLFYINLTFWPDSIVPLKLGLSIHVAPSLSPSGMYSFIPTYIVLCILSLNLKIFWDCHLFSLLFFSEEEGPSFLGLKFSWDSQFSFPEHSLLGASTRVSHSRIFIPSFSLLSSPETSGVLHFLILHIHTYIQHH